MELAASALNAPNLEKWAYLHNNPRLEGDTVAPWIPRRCPWNIRGSRLPYDPLHDYWENRAPQLEVWASELNLPGIERWVNENNRSPYDKGLGLPEAVGLVKPRVWLPRRCLYNDFYSKMEFGAYANNLPNLTEWARYHANRPPLPFPPLGSELADLLALNALALGCLAIQVLADYYFSKKP